MSRSRCPEQHCGRPHRTRPQLDKQLTSLSKKTFSACLPSQQKDVLAYHAVTDDDYARHHVLFSFFLFLIRPNQSGQHSRTHGMYRTFPNSFRSSAGTKNSLLKCSRTTGDRRGGWLVHLFRLFPVFFDQVVDLLLGVLDSHLLDEIPDLLLHPAVVDVGGDTGGKSWTVSSRSSGFKPADSAFSDSRSTKASRSSSASSDQLPLTPVVLQPSQSSPAVASPSPNSSRTPHRHRPRGRRGSPSSPESWQGRPCVPTPRAFPAGRRRQFHFHRTHKVHRHHDLQVHFLHVIPRRSCGVSGIPERRLPRRTVIFQDSILLPT